MRVFINIKEANGRNRQFPVSEAPLKIGRGSAAEVKVDDSLCSQLHISFYVNDEQLFLEDLASKNGVYLNGVQVYKQRVYTGDLIKIGKTEIQISETKNSHDVLQKLSSENDRSNGNITIELEDRSEIEKRQTLNPAKLKKEMEYIKNAKLYSGAPKVEEKSPHRFLAFKDFLAVLIDLFLALLIFMSSYVLLKNLEPALYQEKLADGATFRDLLSKDVFLYTIGGIVAGGVFFKWSRSRDSGSVGEKIMKLD